MREWNETETSKALNEVKKERKQQHEKWGEQNWKPSEWLSILGEEFGEVCRAVYEEELQGEERRGAYRKELIQLAVVAVQMVECLDRQEGK